jgi:hypothetical protein
VTSRPRCHECMDFRWCIYMCKISEMKQRSQRWWIAEWELQRAGRGNMGARGLKTPFGEPCDWFLLVQDLGGFSMGDGAMGQNNYFQNGNKKGPCCCVHMNLQVTLMLKDLHVPRDPRHTKHEISKDQCFKDMHVIASCHESQMIHGWSWIET